MRFYSVVKPGIIFGNIVTVCGGFFLGSTTPFHFSLFLATLLGMILVIASGCVLNNVIDRDIDALMERTRHRVLVKGLVSPTVAVGYGIVLGLAGFIVLYQLANPLTVWVAFIGWFVYVILYSLFLKRNSTHGTVVGAVSGAVPPVAGYVAVTNRLDVGAALLFLILFFWQMPHFYAIAIYRLSDYKAASIPVLPLAKDIPHTKKVVFYYALAFAVAAILPSVFHYTGVVYLVVAIGLGLAWLYVGWQGIRAKVEDHIWAKKMFLFSIFIITLLSMMMAVK